MLDVALPLRAEDETLGILRLRFEYSRDAIASGAQEERAAATTGQTFHDEMPRLDAHRQALPPRFHAACGCGYASARLSTSYKTPSASGKSRSTACWMVFASSAQMASILRANRALAAMAG
jgi:hypothetical protein